MAETQADQSERRCVHCFEVIHPKARLCPHCRSPQKPKRLQEIGTFLKWVGGITAVISLIIGMVRVNELYSSWRERSAAIDELVAAARLQQDARDYEGGWRLLQQALQMDPSSPAVRDYQGPFAMAWLRDFRVANDLTFSSVVDPLLPVLYRGAANPDQTIAGDTLAHIGWANYLKLRDGHGAVKIDEFYARALALDPDNPYGNIHWAHWVLYNGNDRDYGEANIDKARRHIEAALASGRDRDYVLNMAFYALDNSSERGTLAETMRLAHRISQSAEMLDPGVMRSLQSIYEPIGRGLEPRGVARLEELARILPPEALLATYNWILTGIEVRGPLAAADLPGNRFIIGRLHELAGNRARALQIYRGLRDHPSLHKGYREGVLEPVIEKLEGE